MDDFYALQLDKMEKYLCLKQNDVVIPDGDIESSSDDDDDDDDDDDSDDDQEKQEADGDNPKNGHDEEDEEDAAEEEHQPTAEIQGQANEESTLSQVKLHSFP